MSGLGTVYTFSVVYRPPSEVFAADVPYVYAIVNLGDLNQFADGATVDEAALLEAKLIRGKYDGVKILGTGELTKKLVVKAERFSASAKEKIEKAGGSIEVIEHPVAPVVRHKKKKAKAKAAKS